MDRMVEQQRPMALRIETDPAKVDRGAWRRLVDAHPRGSAFQCPEMFDVYAATPGFRPLLAAAVVPDGSIAGVMLGVLQDTLPSPLGGLLRRTVAWGGPLVSEGGEACVASLLAGFATAVGGRGVYVQLRNLWDVSPWNAEFVQAGYGYEEHLEVRVDLTRGEDVLWRGLAASRRTRVRQAARDGVRCARLRSPGEMAIAHSLVRAAYRARRLPLPDPLHFHALHSVLGPAGLVRYFGAYRGERLVSVRIVLSHGRSLYDLWAAQAPDAHPSAGSALAWEVLRWGARRGYPRFDFGGAGSPHQPYGVRDFKRSFGGDVVGFGRYTHVHRPAVYRTAAAGYALLRRSFGRTSAASSAAPRPS